MTFTLDRDPILEVLNLFSEKTQSNDLLDTLQHKTLQPL